MNSRDNGDNGDNKDNRENNDIRDNEDDRATGTTRTLNRSSGKAVQLMANFFPVLSDSPRRFCESYKCNSVQFPSCFYSGECRRELKFRGHS